MPLSELEQLKLEKLKRERATRSGQLSTQATEEQYLPTGERLSGGFRREENLRQVREQQRSERGLAPGTPLEPTGFNLRNALDLPGDLADVIGPAMPIISAGIGGFLAGAATLPSGPGAVAGIAAGGAAGGAAGEFAKQRIGAGMGFDQGTVIEQLGEVAKQGAWGTAQEVGGVFLGRMLNATKIQMLNTANKLIEKRGAEGFVKGWGAIATHMDRAKTQFALDAVKRGDRRILDRVFADKDFSDKFARKLFYGKDDDMAKQIFKLSHGKSGSKEVIRDLFKEFVGIQDDIFETIYTKGALVSKFNNPNVIKSLGNNINKGLDDMFNTAGKELESARGLLGKAGKNVPVGQQLAQFNTILSEHLAQVGFLTREGKGLFSVNPKYAGTVTGTSQAKMFGQLVERFFGDAAGKAGGAVTLSDKSILQKLVSGKKVFSINNKINFGDFIDKLKSIDVQISGQEFKSLGKLSPDLAMYLRGIRSIPVSVEQNLGFRGLNVGRVGTLTQAFEELAENSSLLKQGTKIKSVTQIEAALQRFAKVQPGTTAAQQVSDLNLFLQRTLKVNFLDDLKTFKAAQTMKELNTTFGDEQIRKKVTSLMKNAFHEDVENPLVNILKTRVDEFLPEGLKIGELSEIHTIATALHKDAASILRAKFMWSSLLAPVTGGLAGLAYGPAGGAVGVVTGMALQQPGVLRLLIRLSAKMSNTPMEKLIVKGLSDQIKQSVRLMPAGGRLLNQLLQQR